MYFGDLHVCNPQRGTPAPCFTRGQLPTSCPAQPQVTRRTASFVGVNTRCLCSPRRNGNLSIHPDGQMNHHQVPILGHHGAGHRRDKRKGIPLAAVPLFLG
jgi:hypothetical protein